MPKTPLNTAPSSAWSWPCTEQGLDQVTSRGAFQPQPFHGSVNSTQYVNSGQNKCFNLFCGGWKQQTKTSDLTEDTPTVQHHLAETSQDGYSCVLSVTVQSLQRGILEMESSANWGDEARKDNAGSHVTPPEGWGSGGALSCSYKPQLWISTAPWLTPVCTGYLVPRAGLFSRWPYMFA